MSGGPKKPVFTEDATIPTTHGGDTGGARLLIFGEGEPTSFPLLEAGSYTIGRSLEADVYVKDPSLSRLHAVLSFDAARGFTIKDLGSSNGTTLRGARLAPQVESPVAIGEPLELGRCTVLIQRGATLERPRRLWPHSYFELRLEDLAARARSSGAPFSILRARIHGGTETSAIEDLLISLLSPDDLVSAYAPLEYDLLLAHGNPVKADETASALRLGLRRLGAEVDVGLACFPRDGLEPGELIARVGAGVRSRARVQSASPSERIITLDPAMRGLYALVDRIADSDISVLVLGETGVGKEVLATAVHQRSRRRDEPFVALNCGAFTSELLESELFGHEKGAFTGAVKSKPGLLESARNGSVFLDEVGEMSLGTQVKLLRVLEERRLRRLGGLETIPFAARVIAATNRDLEAAVKSGAFREDLYYRLNGFTMIIPPLRERKSEIAPLAAAFAREMARREGSGASGEISPAARQALEQYAWPGNVRELKNVLERAVVLAGSEIIDPRHLPMEKLSSSVVFAAERSSAPTRKVETVPEREREPAELKARLGDVERDAIMAALEQCGGNQTRAAEMLGMSRKSLVRRLDQYDVPRPRKGRSDSDPE